MAITTLDQFSCYIWLNGELLKADKAKLHIFTHSLHYSGAAFEGEKSYNGKVFKLEEHTTRLLESAKTLMLNVPYSHDDIIKAHYEIIKKNNILDSYIRPLIWRGPESLNITNKSLSVNVMIAAIPSFPKLDNGLNVHLSRWEKPSPKSMPTQCKSSGHYNMMIICKEEALELGFDDAILLDSRGFIAECTTSNIFFVKDDELFTPIPDSFLNGITRQTVIELARNLGLKVKEEYITLDKIKEFKECFITGTAAEVKAITSITLPDSKIVFEETKITNLLQQEYANLVRR